MFHRALKWWALLSANILTGSRIVHQTIDVLSCPWLRDVAVKEGVSANRNRSVHFVQVPDNTNLVCHEH